MYKYIVDENKIHLHSLRNRPEKAYLKLAFLPSTIKYTYILYLSCNCVILSTNKEGQINFSVI